MSLSIPYVQGQTAALALFGLETKEAGWLGNLGSMAKSMAIGNPGQVLREGVSTFKAPGLLSTKNVFWPAVKGPGGSKLNWLQRAGTAMVPLQIAGAMKADSDNPNDGMLSKGLGAAGAIAGNMYGFPALGLIGAPLASRALGHVGRGIGRTLESI